MLRFTRFQSSIAGLKSKIASGEVPITKQLIESAVKDNEFHVIKSAVTKNPQLLNDSIRSEMAQFISHDFSIYYLLKDHKFTENQLASLIAHNPERVDSSWDLYNRHNQGFSQIVSTELIKKMISDPMESDWPKIIHLFNQITDKLNIQEVIFENLSGSEDNVSKLQYFEFDTDFLVGKLAQLEGIGYTICFSKVMDTELPLELYAKAFDNFVEVQTDVKLVQQVNQISSSSLEPKTITLNDIVEQIEVKKLDSSKKPESLLIRIKLMEFYGMNSRNFEMLLKKFHHYQTHCTFGIEIIQNSLIQAYCLKAFEEQATEVFPIIDVLLLEEIPIKVLQSLILSNSAIDVDKSLEIYNQYINHVSVTPNEHTQRSPAGLLNESIILSYLYNNDRDFANIIMDKITQSNLLAEHEVTIIRKLFKVYGDAFVEDEWDLAKPKLHSYIVNTIRNL